MRADFRETYDPAKRYMISGGLLNKQAVVLNSLTGEQPPAFGTTVSHQGIRGTALPPPHVQGIAEIIDAAETCAEVYQGGFKTTEAPCRQRNRYLAYFRYFGWDDDQWTRDPVALHLDAGPYFEDSGTEASEAPTAGQDYGAIPQYRKGDLVCAYWDERRGTLVPIQGAFQDTPMAEFASAGYYEAVSTDTGTDNPEVSAVSVFIEVQEDKGANFLRKEVISFSIDDSVIDNRQVSGSTSVSFRIFNGGRIKLTAVNSSEFDVVCINKRLRLSGVGRYGIYTQKSFITYFDPDYRLRMIGDKAPQGGSQAISRKHLWIGGGATLSAQWERQVQVEGRYKDSPAFNYEGDGVFRVSFLDPNDCWVVTAEANVSISVTGKPDGGHYECCQVVCDVTCQAVTVGEYYGGLVTFIGRTWITYYVLDICDGPLCDCDYDECIPTAWPSVGAFESSESTTSQSFTSQSTTSTSEVISPSSMSGSSYSTTSTSQTTASYTSPSSVTDISTGTSQSSLSTTSPSSYSTASPSSYSTTSSTSGSTTSVSYTSQSTTSYSTTSATSMTSFSSWSSSSYSSLSTQSVSPSSLSYSTTSQTPSSQSAVSESSTSTSPSSYSTTCTSYSSQSQESWSSYSSTSTTSLEYSTTSSTSQSQESWSSYSSTSTTSQSYTSEGFSESTTTTTSQSYTSEGFSPSSQSYTSEAFSSSTSSTSQSQESWSSYSTTTTTSQSYTSEGFSLSTTSEGFSVSTTTTSSEGFSESTTTTTSQSYTSEAFSESTSSTSQSLESASSASTTTTTSQSYTSEGFSQSTTTTTSQSYTSEGFSQSTTTTTSQSYTSQGFSLSTTTTSSEGLSLSTTTTTSQSYTSLSTTTTTSQSYTSVSTTTTSSEGLTEADYLCGACLNSEGPYSFNITLAGITEIDECDSCPGVNGTHTVTWQSNCQWSENVQCEDNNGIGYNLNLTIASGSYTGESYYDNCLCSTGYYMLVRMHWHISAEDNSCACQGVWTPGGQRFNPEMVWVKCLSSPLDCMNPNFDQTMTCTDDNREIDPDEITGCSSTGSTCRVWV